MIAGVFPKNSFVENGELEVGCLSRILSFSTEEDRALSFQIFLFMWLVVLKEILPHRKKSNNQFVRSSGYNYVRVTFSAFVFVVWHQETGWWN